MTPPQPDRIIMPDDPEAATEVTVTAWRSRDGHLFLGVDAERIARGAGATHRPCEDCGQPARCNWVCCDPCREKRDNARHTKLPKAEWDGACMIYSDARGKYYASPDDALDDCSARADAEGARLLLTKPCQWPTLEPEYFADSLPDNDECELPEEIMDAIEAFNTAVQAVPTCAWEPAKIALDLDTVEFEEASDDE